STAGNHGERARASPDAWAVEGHRRPQQESQGRIARHGVILLRGGKREENQNKAGPAERQEPRPPRPVHRPERKLRDGRKIDAPGKQPRQVQQPEIQARDRIVIARIAQVEEAEKLLIDEEEPQESMVLAGTAVQRKSEVRRIPESGQNVPGSRNQNHDEDSAHGMETLPGSRGDELMRKAKVDEAGGQWKNDSNQTLQQETGSQACRKEECPETRMGLTFVE